MEARHDSCSEGERERHTATGMLKAGRGDPKYFRPAEGNPNVKKGVATPTKAKTLLGQIPARLHSSEPENHGETRYEHP